MEPLLRERATPMDPAEAARLIAEFFTPEQDATTWFMLVTGPSPASDDRHH
ncbi:MAG: hypothetical protein GX814_10415 [Microbacteriaceae bacterium]|nr:hypothetical protein [Microbacteriaceae bacterium]